MRSIPSWATAMIAGTMMAACAVGAEDRPAAPTSGTPSPADAEAEQVLKRSGVKHGLCVVVGACGGELAEALGRRVPALVVHGLEADGRAVEGGRKRIQGGGALYGRVSLERWDKPTLPHASETVNLLIAQNRGRVAEDECRRVIAPGGTLIAKAGADWSVWAKPLPPELAEWPHPLGNAGGTLSNADRRVGPPEVMQWIAGPMFGVKPRVAADGLLFAAWMDDPQDRARFVQARDAFNGLLAWQGRFPVARPRERFSYGWHQDAGASACWLSTGGGRLFILADPKPVSVDARTGTGSVAYETPAPAKRALPLDGGVVFATLAGVYRFDGRGGPPRWEAQINAGDAVAADGRIFVVDEQPQAMAVAALDAGTGKEVWRAPVKDVPAGEGGKNAVTPLRVPCAGNGRVMVWQKAAKPILNPGHIEADRIACLDAASGKELWRIQAAERGCLSLGYPSYVMMAHGMVWVLGIQKYTNAKGKTENGFTYFGLDPATGREMKRWGPANICNAICVPAFATGNYVGPRDNLIAIDTMQRVSGTAIGARSGCVTGSVPAYGLLYNGSHCCSCGGGYINLPNQTLKAGYPLSREPKQPGLADKGESVLEPGPAASDASSLKIAAFEDEWPTFLATPQRNPGIKSSLPPRGWQPLWKTDLPVQGATEYRSVCGAGDVLTAPTVAGGKVVVANPDAMTVHALDAGTGKEAWRFVAGGLIDSPPTLASGLCVFGAADGWVYALRAADGALAWRHRLARGDRRICTLGQVQSAWPVNGSVLVLGDRVIAAAGWYNFAAHHVWIYGLDLATGRAVWSDEAGAPNRNGILKAHADLTVLGRNPADGSFPGKRKPAGGTGYLGPEPFSVARSSPTDRAKGHTTILTVAGERFIYRLDQTRGRLSGLTIEEANRYGGKAGMTLDVPKTDVIDAILLSGNSLFLAGRHAAGEGNLAGFLRTLDAADLKPVAELPLPDAPVFQGLAAAYGRLYLSLREGGVLCLGQPGSVKQ